MIVANAFYDRAGYTLLGDIYHSTTFGPWKRALVKVDKEETFHLRHGEQNMRKINQTPEGHEALQQAVDWMFMLTVEWFGLPDQLKRHGEQLDYGFKGHSNDELRQIWMSTAVPLCKSYTSTFPHIMMKSRKSTSSIAFSLPISMLRRNTGCSKTEPAAGMM